MTDKPIEPPPLSRTALIAYLAGLPLALLVLIFVPAGRLDWWPGWTFVIVYAALTAISACVLARVNPIIYRARSRFQPGTLGWDRRIVAVMLSAMAASLPVSALDAGRFHWSTIPGWGVALGYALLVASVAITAWAQAVNRFFEPGVRLQTERHQRVIDTGPYRFVRHPGYVGGILQFVSFPLALHSLWGLIPAAIASVLLLVRTSWEDRLLQLSLPGYADYARRVRFRLMPGVW